MCECTEYDDGSMYLCPVDADIHRSWERQQGVAALHAELEAAVRKAWEAWWHYDEVFEQPYVHTEGYRAIAKEADAEVGAILRKLDEARKGEG